MGFTTPIFLFGFFPLSVAGYYGAVLLEKKVPACEKWRLPDLVLLLVSLVFYSWVLWVHGAYLLGYIAAVYALGRYLAGGRRAGASLALAAGLVVLIAILYYYRYYDFTLLVAREITGWEFAADRNVIVPLGISFLTFTAVSYLVDVYRGEQGAGSPLDAALYLALFTKVISGPIVRWKDFGAQVRRRELSVDRFVSGLNRIMIGFGKKLILADSFGVICADIQKFQGGIDVPTAWGCAFLYMLQIYYDFSGYSDIAIGLARLFGFETAENFRFPYVAASITEFWRRWHISLGTWFREYVYIPLGGSRRGRGRTLLNLGIVFLLTGVWHGAGWGYLCWGALHGVCRIAEKCLEKTRFYERIPRAVKYLGTMLVVMIGWEAFRLGNLPDTIRFLGIMFHVVRFDWISRSFRYYFTARTLFLTAVGVIGATAFSAAPLRRLQQQAAEKRGLFVLQEAGLLLLMAAAVMFMVNSAYSPFIYFQY